MAAVLMSFRPGSERHFTTAIDLFKAVNFLGFLMRRKQMMYFIRPRNYPTWKGIAGHFTIITSKPGEKPTCVHLLRHKTYGTYSMDWFWSFCTLTGPPRKNNGSNAWNSCGQSTGKVKFKFYSDLNFFLNRCHLVQQYS